MYQPQIHPELTIQKPQKALLRQIYKLPENRPLCQFQQNCSGTMRNMHSIIKHKALLQEHLLMMIIPEPERAQPTDTDYHPLQVNMPLQLQLDSQAPVDLTSLPG